MTEQLASDRFRLVRKLGAGGSGVVYEAYDKATDATVAIKVLHALGGDALFRFKREFRVFADIEHRNLIRFGELLSDGDEWFFTMEIIRGPDFINYVSSDSARRLAVAGEETITTRQLADSIGSSGITGTCDTIALDDARRDIASQPKPIPNAYDEQRLRSALRHLATAIQALHDTGRIHRDIKPSNALVRENGEVVLLDFGLVEFGAQPTTNRMPRKIRVSALSSSDTTAPSSRPAGTPAYMAPEQITGEPLGPECDWYAFGMMMFRALTGVLPRSGRVYEVLNARVSSDPVAPSTLIASVPADLDSLCHRLLARDPAQRPTGREVLAALGVTDRGDTNTSTLALGQEVFVGRELELAALTSAFDRSRAGSPTSVLVEGEAGVGKSALVQQFLEENVAADCEPLVLFGRCYEQETVPFRAFDTLVDALCLHLLALERDVVDTLVQDGVSFLAAVFPVLRRVSRIDELAAPSLEHDNPLERRTQAFREIKALVRALAASRPLVLVIENLQWADPDSLDLLDHLLAVPRAPAFMLIATRRTGEEGAGAAASELAAIVSRFERLEVRGLDDEQTKVLWSALWERTPASTRPMLTPQIAAEASGHPMFLTELVRYAHGRGDVAVGLRLEDALWQRVRALEEPARRFLEFLALSGVPTELQTVRRAADLDGEEVLRLLHRLRLGQFVRLAEGDERRVETYHDRLREAIIAGLESEPVVGDGSRVKRMHLTLGREIKAAAGDSIERELFAAVRHLNAARELISDETERTELVALNLMACRKAKGTTAYQAALHYVSVALEIAGNDTWASDYELARSLEAERVEIVYLAGDRDKARTEFDQLVTKVKSNRERTALFETMIRLERGAGEFGLSIGRARSMLAKLGIKVPKRGSLPAFLLELVKVQRLLKRQPIEQLVDGPQASDERAQLAARLLIDLATSAYFCDTMLMTFGYARAVRLALTCGVAEGTSDAIGGLGMVISGMGKHGKGKSEEALAMVQHAMRLRARLDGPERAGRLESGLGAIILPWARPVAEAIDVLHRGAESARRVGNLENEGFCATIAASLAGFDHVTVATCHQRHSSAYDVARRYHNRDLCNSTSFNVRFYARLMAAEPVSLANGPALVWDDICEEGFSFESAGQSPASHMQYYFQNGKIEYLFGDPMRAFDYFSAGWPFGKLFYGLVLIAEYRFYYALSAVKAMPSMSWAQRRKARKLVLAVIHEFRRGAESCPENFAQHAVLLQAEWQLAKHSNPDAVLRGYGQAALTGEQYGSSPVPAIAYERAFELCRQLGRAEAGEEYRARAVEAFRSWGAEAKATQLERE